MTIQNGTKRSFSKTIVVAMSLFASLLLAACQHDHRVREDIYTGSLYKFAHTNHPIHVGRGSLYMAIPVGAKDRKLNREKRDELQMFLHYYRNQGTGRLRVSMPSQARHKAAVRNVLDDVHYELVQMSIGQESVHLKKYRGQGYYPEIRLSFERYEAHGPECGDWNENLARSENNHNAQFWGCATQKNLAAMVSNPRDLKGPRGWSPRDSRRRDAVWDKFIKGDVVGTKRSQDERVDVSGISK